MRKGTVIVILLMSFILTACGRDEVTEKTLMNDFAQRYNTVAQDMKVSTHIRSARYEVMENGLPYFVLELENKEVSASVFLNRSKKDIVSTNVRFDPYKKEDALAAGDFLFVVLAMYAKGSRQEILDALLPVFNDGQEMLLFSNKSKRGYRIHKDHDKKREKDVITILATDQSGNKLLSMSSKDVKEVTLD